MARSAGRIAGDRLRFLCRPVLVWLLLVTVCGLLVVRVDVARRAGTADRFRHGVVTAAHYAGAYIADRIDRQRERAQTMLTGPVVSRSDLELAVAGLGYAAAGVTDGRGRLLAATPQTPELIGRDVTGLLEQVRLAVRANRPGISGVFVSPLIDRPVVAIGVPFDTPYGRRVFFGPMPVQESALGVYIKRTGLRLGEQTWLLDRTGNLIVTSGGRGPEVTTLGAESRALARALARRPAGDYRENGARWVYASHPVPGTGWFMVSSVPRQKLNGAVDSSRIVYLGVLVAGAALTLVAAVLIGLGDRQRVLSDRRTDLLNQRLEQSNQALQRANEELRRSNQELHRSNEDLRQFSYSVAHDLRAPLRAITGFSEILVGECGEHLDQTERGYLHRIAQASRRMSALIDGLLDLARVARAQPDTELVDLSAMARGIAAELSEGEPERRVAFFIADGVTALADPGLIRLVLENLLGNAWKFTAGTPAALIEFGTVATGTGQAGYFVRDNGVGFDPAYADKLFQPFERLHNAKEHAGSGVGLASVRRIIERHGGKVGAKGEPGAGATFTFTLPAATGDRARDRARDRAYDRDRPPTDSKVPESTAPRTSHR